MKKLMSTAIIFTIILTASLVFAGQTIEFKDGTIIKGEIQNETLTVETSFGKLKPPTAQIAFVSEGTVELRDGSKIMGDLVVDDEGIVIKTKYGTWTLTFKPEDVTMITFSK